MRNALLKKGWLIPAVSLAIVLLGACSRQPVYPEPTRAGEDIEVPVDALKHSTPQFYTYRYRNKDVNFFVIKVDDRVLAFLDACKKCYPAKRGYGVDDGYIVCRACNVRYSISKVEGGFGSCFPIRITGRLQDGNYLIPVSDLEKGAKFF